jgi:hypothetical protein
METPTPATKTYTIRVLVQQKDGAFIAQCLEYDIAAQAKTLPDLYYEVERLLIGRCVVAKERGSEPFEGLKPAPAHYWQLFDRAPFHVSRDRPLPFGGVTPDLAACLAPPEIRLAEPALA